MSVMHCPLCVGLAVLSVLQAASHLVLLWMGPELLAALEGGRDRRLPVPAPGAFPDGLNAEPLPHLIEVPLQVLLTSPARSLKNPGSAKTLMA